MSQPAPRDHREAGTRAQPLPAPSLPAAEPALASPLPHGSGHRRARWLILLSALGPGVIAAAAGNDAGGIATYSQTGAGYGLSLLWSIVVVTIGLIVVQEMCARMGAVTGKGLAALIRENFGVKVTLFAMGILLLANFATTVSEFAGITAVGELYLGTQARFIIVPFAIALVWLLVSRGSYQKLERVLLIASLVFVTYIITALKIGVPWTHVATATLGMDIKSTHWNAALILMIVQLIGTTIAPYMQFYQQSAVRDKGVQMKDYALTRWDTIIGCRAVQCGCGVYYYRLRAHPVSAPGAAYHSGRGAGRRRTRASGRAVRQIIICFRPIERLADGGGDCASVHIIRGDGSPGLGVGTGATHSRTALILRNIRRAHSCGGAADYVPAARLQPYSSHLKRADCQLRPAAGGVGADAAAYQPPPIDGEICQQSGLQYRGVDDDSDCRHAVPIPAGQQSLAAFPHALIIRGQ